jgi:hypothetical protein
MQVINYAHCYFWAQNKPQVSINSCELRPSTPVLAEENAHFGRIQCLAVKRQSTVKCGGLLFDIQRHHAAGESPTYPNDSHKGVIRALITAQIV